MAQNLLTEVGRPAVTVVEGVCTRKGRVSPGCAARSYVAVGYPVRLARGSTPSSAQQAARHTAAAPRKETKVLKGRKVLKNPLQGCADCADLRLGLVREGPAPGQRVDLEDSDSAGEFRSGGLRGTP